MRDEILNSIENPKQLEKLYRNDKSVFKAEFNSLYPEIKSNKISEFWKERLNYETNEISWGSNYELIFIIIASCIAGLIAKLPEFTGINSVFFFQRNIAFVVLPLLTIYFAWKQNLSSKKNITISTAIIISLIFINILPENNSDTTILACIHLPLFLWAVLGFTFIGNKVKDYKIRLDFLRFNGDLLVMTGIILIAGTLLTAITLGLFSIIEIHLEEFYFNYIVIWGLASSPIVGTYLVRSNPQLVNKVSPVIAKVFTPLVLITLTVYLFAIIYSGEDPYRDRDFLIIFNILLIGVMAIILFSVAETTKNYKSKIAIIMLLLLSIVTIIINGIALSAIVFRISEWGITPNRLAVLGSNLLILINLLFVAYRLFKASKNLQEIENVEKTIAHFLPIYSLWTVFVIFIFPLIFIFD
jgi:hypothetical protein